MDHLGKTDGNAAGSFSTDRGRPVKGGGAAVVGLPGQCPPARVGDLYPRALDRLAGRECALGLRRRQPADEANQHIELEPWAVSTASKQPSALLASSSSRRRSSAVIGCRPNKEPIEDGPNGGGVGWGLCGSRRRYPGMPNGRREDQPPFHVAPVLRGNRTGSDLSVKRHRMASPALQATFSTPSVKTGNRQKRAYLVRSSKGASRRGRDGASRLARLIPHSSPTNSRSHRRAGIGACRRTITQARLRRWPSRESNSTRPRVTVRPSGRRTAPPAASTAATRSRSAVRYASTSDSMWCMSGPTLSACRQSTRSGQRSLKHLSTIRSIQPKDSVGSVGGRLRAIISDKVGGGSFQQLVWRDGGLKKTGPEVGRHRR
jgi:hypothetical protein